MSHFRKFAGLHFIAKQSSPEKFRAYIQISKSGENFCATQFHSTVIDMYNSNENGASTTLCQEVRNGEASQMKEKILSSKMYATGVNICVIN